MVYSKTRNNDIKFSIFCHRVNPGTVTKIIVNEEEFSLTFGSFLNCSLYDHCVREV